MAGRRPDRRLIKLHRSYTVEETANVLGIAKGSVRRWLKQGLPHFSDRRPILILGSDLRIFLEKRARPKQRCKPHELYCFTCKGPKRPGGGLVEYARKTAQSGQLSAICETCTTMMHKNFSASKLPLLALECDVHVRGAMQD